MKPIKKKELDIVLQGLKGFDSPSEKLEQYITPATIASDILLTAMANGDIQNKKFVDLGCGTGIFAIGAKLLGAKEVIGIDIDPRAIEAAKENAASLGLDIDFREMDVGQMSVGQKPGKFDTVFQNPPFGAQNRHADRPFLEKAMELADVVWTIHNSDTADFVVKFAASLGFGPDLTKNYKFEIKHTFGHHRKERADIDVTVFRFVRIDA